MCRILDKNWPKAQGYTEQKHRKSDSHQAINTEHTRHNDGDNILHQQFRRSDAHCHYSLPCHCCSVCTAKVWTCVGGRRKLERVKMREIRRGTTCVILKVETTKIFHMKALSTIETVLREQGIAVAPAQCSSTDTPSTRPFAFRMTSLRRNQYIFYGSCPWTEPDRTDRRWRGKRSHAPLRQNQHDARNDGNSLANIMAEAHPMKPRTGAHGAHT